MYDIIIPCYNEESRLEYDRIAAFLAANPAIRFTFVNDGSHDRTPAQLQAFRQEDPARIRVLDLPKNRGKAEAVRCGILDALQSPDCELVGFWDADLATPLDTITLFLQEFARDPQLLMVFGCRFKHFSNDIRRKASRHYLGRLFATVISCYLKLGIYDTQCGAKIFRPALAARLFAAPFISNWFFDVELFREFDRLYDLKKHPELCREYPLAAWDEKEGSKITFVSLCKSSCQLLRVILRR